MEYLWRYDKNYEWGWDREYWTYDKLKESDATRTPLGYRKKTSFVEDYWEEVKLFWIPVRKVLRSFLVVLKLKKRIVRYLKGKKTRRRKRRRNSKREQFKPIFD